MTARRLALVLVIGLVVACGSSDAPLDAAVASDAAPDAWSYPECALAAPLVGGTAETDAIADAPPRCG
ncbi:MAG: hypothetical protein M3Y87_37025, partial [Myxococcota bacterium]|nr:hypothetical protein [Myxococcota bacterium]